MNFGDIFMDSNGFWRLVQDIVNSQRVLQGLKPLSEHAATQETNLITEQRGTAAAPAAGIDHDSKLYRNLVKRPRFTKLNYVEEEASRTEMDADNLASFRLHNPRTDK